MVCIKGVRGNNTMGYPEIKILDAHQCQPFKHEMSSLFKVRSFEKAISFRKFGVMLSMFRILKPCSHWLQY